MLSHGLNRCMQQMGSAQESPNTCMVKEIRRFLAGGTRRPHLSVGALKRPAKKDALVCMIALEGPSYRPALQKHQHNAPLFYHTKKHNCGTKWGHIVLVQILCAPSGRIWMDFTWWTKLGERNRQWEHVALCKYPCHQPSLLLKDYNYIMTFRKMVFESSYTEQSEGNIHNCR